MGYFNFYILRKLIKNKKIFKFLLFIIIFLIIIFLKNHVFASTILTHDGTDYIVADLPTTPYAYDIVFFFASGNGNVNYDRFQLYSFTGVPYVRQMTSSGNQVWRIRQVISSPPGYYRYYTCRLDSMNPNRTWSTNNYDYPVDSSEGTINSTFSSEADLLDSICYSNTTINYYGTNIPAWSPTPVYENFPYILNATDDIAIGGQDLIIMPGDFPNTTGFNFKLYENNPEEIGAGNIQDNWTLLFNLLLDNTSSFYMPIDESGVGFYYKIPWSYLSNYLTLSKEYRYSLEYDENGTPAVDNIDVVYGGNTPADAIYNQGIQQQQSMNELNNNINNLNDSMQDTTSAVEDLNDTMTDSSITSSASDLPTTDVQDPTQNGIDNIFQSIYNAFCTGQAQDIVFPVPFTNKNIILSPYYVRDMLTNNNAGWVYTLIQAFWGYLIGRFIVKDISNKINKIKGGDIENIENNNIKEEML